MTRKEGILFYSSVIENKLGITLAGIEFCLDKWGRADNHLFLNTNHLLVIDITKED